MASASLDRFWYRPDEPVGGWLRAFPPADEGAAPKANATTREYLRVRLGGEVFGLPVDAIRELRAVPPLTAVPRGPPGLAGVMTLRGEMLPVYDVHQRLRVAEVPPARGARVVVVRDHRGDAGLLVDLVDGVSRVASALVEPPTNLGPWATGIARLGDALVILLDVERLLS